jgi:regulator of protease activity HflC (stomatin/prohibitin superfamily)
VRREELAIVAERLSELAEVLGGKAPSAKALPVWLDALAECPIDDVKFAFTDWPKRAVKMPAPADILKACRERMSARAEREGQQERIEGKALAPIYRRQGTSEAELKAKAEIRAILAGCSRGFIAGTFQHIGGRNSADPLEWARVLRVRHEAGEILGSMQVANYRSALGL